MEKLISKKFFEQKLLTPIEAKTFNIKDYIHWEHSQDCCENVYIDFDHIDSYRDMINSIWEIIKIEWWTAPEDWVIIKIYNKEWNNYGIYLPCRNEQNWYYNDALEIIFNIEWVETNFELQWMWCVENIIS